MLRMGGQSQYLPWSFKRKHPIILPAEMRFTKLLFERNHHKLLHGPLLLLSSIRETYWLIKDYDKPGKVALNAFDVLGLIRKNCLN